MVLAYENAILNMSTHEESYFWKRLEEMGIENGCTNDGGFWWKDPISNRTEYCL